MKRKMYVAMQAALILVCLEGSAQQPPVMRPYYEKARDAYLEAASKTKCPQRASYLRAMAQYEDCVAGTFAGKSTACSMPAGDVPPCQGDMIGAAGTATTSDEGQATVPAASSIVSDQGASQSAATAAFQGALDEGKKPSGAMLEGMLAAARQTSDPRLANAYAGTGLVMGGLMALGERRAAKKQQLAAMQQLQETREAEQAAAEHSARLKQDFATYLSDAFHPVYSEGSRQAVLCWIPLTQEQEDTQVYVTNPLPVYPDGYGDFPLREDLYERMAALQQNLPFDASRYKMILFYPLNASSDIQGSMDQLQQQATQAGMQLQITSMP